MYKLKSLHFDIEIRFYIIHLVYIATYFSPQTNVFRVYARSCEYNIYTSSYAGNLRIGNTSSNKRTR